MIFFSLRLSGKFHVENIKLSFLEKHFSVLCFLANRYPGFVDIFTYMKRFGLKYFK